VNILSYKIQPPTLRIYYMVAYSKWYKILARYKHPHDRHIMGRHYDWGDDNSSTDVDCVEKDDKGILRGWVNNKHAAMSYIDINQERININFH